MPIKKISRRSFLTISAMTTAAVAFDWRRIAAHAAQMGPNEAYPTVVIGAGLGGLCCAAYLARQGIPVTVIEQHSVPAAGWPAVDPVGRDLFFSLQRQIHGRDHPGGRISDPQTRQGTGQGTGFRNLLADPPRHHCQHSFHR